MTSRPRLASFDTAIVGRDGRLTRHPVPTGPPSAGRGPEAHCPHQENAPRVCDRDTPRMASIDLTIEHSDRQAERSMKPATNPGRAGVEGRFFTRDGQRLRLRGVTYGPFAP